MDVNPSDGSFAESSVAAFTRSRAAFDLKGVMSSLTVLRLRSRDLNLIERQLRAKVMQFPQFFHNSPIVLDVSEIEGGIAGFPLAALVRALHVCKVVPVAVTNIDDANRPMAAAAGLGVVSLSAAKPGIDPDAAAEAQRARHEAPTVVTPMPEMPPQARAATAPTPRPQAQATHHGEPAAAQPGSNGHGGNVHAGNTGHQGGYAQHGYHSGGNQQHQAPHHQNPHGQGPSHGSHASASGNPPTASVQPGRATPIPGALRAPLVIRQPVRSGQLIYAENNDLIVLASVNPGAQIVADGNIHIYATMRGRAVAGAKGYTDARIFCQRFEAELIAIAGAYLTFDDIPKDRMGKPAQVFLQNGVCTIGAL